MKRILINSSYGDELRVALVDGAKLYDFDTESSDRTWGNLKAGKFIGEHKPLFPRINSENIL